MTTPSPASAPVRELGYAHGASSWWGGDDSGAEPTPELRWPLSVKVYDAMRSQDAQVISVLRAVTLPVRRTRWWVDGEGCRPEVAQLVAADLGLPLKGGEPMAPPLRTRDRFSWQEHVRLALLMLAHGHSFFEQVYRLDEAGMARLRKLAWRPARTLVSINVAPDGGLQSIEQMAPAGSNSLTVRIPVDRLVAYSNDREGGDWQGRSVLRGCYKNWLLKDPLLRTQYATIQRNGMGVPVYEGQEGATEDDLVKGSAMAQAYRSGETAGAATPHGAKLRLMGVEGDLPEADKPIRYHDEQIARTVLAHFLNLGTQTGSWALGTTFADFFTLSLQTLAEQVADTATQHIVEDLVDLNFGASEPAPRIVFDEIGSQRNATAEAIKALIDAGAVFPDRQLEEFLRNAYGLPPKDSPAPPPTEEPA